jgi:hypothetical protein
MKTHDVKFAFVASVGWKRYPDGTDADRKYYKENLTDYDPNEDHICGHCGMKVPGRFLFCDRACAVAFDAPATPALPDTGHGADEARVERAADQLEQALANLEGMNGEITAERWQSALEKEARAVLAAADAVPLAPEVHRCDWKENEDGQWPTGCGHCFDFIDDGPEENGFKFCPFCGGMLFFEPVRIAPPPSTSPAREEGGE